MKTSKLPAVETPKSANESEGQRRKPIDPQILLEQKKLQLELQVKKKNEELKQKSLLKKQQQKESSLKSKDLKSEEHSKINASQTSGKADANILKENINPQNQYVEPRQSFMLDSMSLSESLEPARTGIGKKDFYNDIESERARIKEVIQGSKNVRSSQVAELDKISEIRKSLRDPKLRESQQEFFRPNQNEVKDDSSKLKVDYSAEQKENTPCINLPPQDNKPKEVLRSSQGFKIRKSDLIKTSIQKAEVGINPLRTSENSNVDSLNAKVKSFIGIKPEREVIGGASKIQLEIANQMKRFKMEEEKKKKSKEEAALQRRQDILRQIKNPIPATRESLKPRDSQTTQTSIVENYKSIQDTSMAKTVDFSLNESEAPRNEPEDIPNISILPRESQKTSEEVRKSAQIEAVNDQELELGDLRDISQSGELKTSKRKGSEQSEQIPLSPRKSPIDDSTKSDNLNQESQISHQRGLIIPDRNQDQNDEYDEEYQYYQEEYLPDEEEEHEKYQEISDEREKRADNDIENEDKNEQEQEQDKQQKQSQEIFDMREKESHNEIISQDHDQDQEGQEELEYTQGEEISSYTNNSEHQEEKTPHLLSTEGKPDSRISLQRESTVFEKQTERDYDNFQNEKEEVRKSQPVTYSQLHSRNKQVKPQTPEPETEDIEDEQFTEKEPEPFYQQSYSEIQKSTDYGVNDQNDIKELERPNQLSFLTFGRKDLQGREMGLNTVNALDNFWKNRTEPDYSFKASLGLEKKNPEQGQEYQKSSNDDVSYSRQWAKQSRSRTNRYGDEMEEERYENYETNQHKQEQEYYQNENAPQESYEEHYRDEEEEQEQQQTEQRDRTEDVHDETWQKSPERGYYENRKTGYEKPYSVESKQARGKVEVSRPNKEDFWCHEEDEFEKYKEDENFIPILTESKNEKPARIRKAWGEPRNEEIGANNLQEVGEEKKEEISQTVPDKLKQNEDLKIGNKLPIITFDKSEDEVTKQKNMKKFEQFMQRRQESEKRMKEKKKEKEVKNIINRPVQGEDLSLVHISDYEETPLENKTPKEVGKYFKEKKPVPEQPLLRQNTPEISHNKVRLQSANISNQNKYARKDLLEEPQSVEISVKSRKSDLKTSATPTNIFHTPKPTTAYKKEFSKASNRQNIKNAITNACLAGEPNRKEREEVLSKLNEVKSDVNFIIAFKTVSARLTLKGLYTYDSLTGEIVRIYSNVPVPETLDATMVENYYNYNNGPKEFKPIQGNKNFSLRVDAVSLYPQFFKKGTTSYLF